MLHYDVTAVIEKFRKSDLSEYPDVTKYERALESGLWVLWVYFDKVQQDGYLNSDEISQILDSRGVSCSEVEIARAFARARKKIGKQKNGKYVSYKIMQKGIQHLQGLQGTGNIEVHYVEGDKPHTARMMPKEVISKTKGDIKIVDPYYGIGTLDMLAALDHKRHVRFLSAMFGREDAGVFSRALKLFKKQYKNTELKKYPNANEFHDRYIITDDTLIILGHGLKDIGGKESFMIVLKDKVSKDIRQQLSAKFNQRWGSSADLA